MIPALIALIMTLVPAQLGGVASAAPPAASFEFDAPKQVDLGAPLDINLSVKQAGDIAGFEATVLFDPAAAEFGGLQVRSNDIKAIGRDVQPLAAVELPFGAVIGAYSCPTGSCITRQGNRHGQGAGGTAKLGTLTLFADQPGTLVIGFSGVKLVDANGNPLDVTLPSTSLTVQVGTASVSPQSGAGGVSPAAGVGTSFAPPAAPWTLPMTSGSNAGPADLTGEGQVTNADATQVAMAWTDLRESGSACGPQVDPQLDLNHDGCIDVSDIQLVASQYTAPSPGDDSGPPAIGARPRITTPSAVAASTLQVNSTGDQDDVKKGDGICRTSAGTCTLRAAIAEANNHTGADTITFNIPGSGVHTIHINSHLPTLWDTTGPTTIDGYTQPGASPNSAQLADNAQIMIQVEGGGESAYDALAITSAFNTIRGLAFYKFKRTFWIYGDGAHDNAIIGDFVGTNAAGTYGAASLSSLQAHGIHIEQGARNNQIGTPNLADRNVISGNARSGIGIWHNATDGQVIQNNIIGMSPDGSRRLSNRLHGIDMNYGTSSDIIGGDGAHEHNVLSGNGYNGADISHTSNTKNNSVIGNYIGTDLSGNSSPGNAYNFRYGIRIKDGASQNLVKDNVIGGMTGHQVNGDGNVGIVILNSYTSQNTLTGNRIGISLNGTFIPNGTGIAVHGSHNTIGPNNIIAGNNGPGIQVADTDADFNTITGNSIYGNAGLGIDLNPVGVNANDAGDGDSGPNQQLNFPVLSSASTSSVSGTACAGCKVEVFVASGGAADHGQGKTLVGTATASGSGSFTAPVTGVASGNYLTATATDTSGDTSEFSANLLVAGGSGGGSSAGINLPGHFEVEDYRTGGEGVGYHDTTPGNTGGAYRNEDVDIQTCTDPTTPAGKTCYNVGWVATGEWLAYNVNVTANGTYTFTVRVATIYSGLSFHFELDGAPIGGSISVPKTGGWQTWTNVRSQPVTLTAGAHTLRIVANSNSFNLNYVDVTAS